MLRIAIAGLMHESNTFAASPTTLDSFLSGGLEQGEGIIRRWGEAHHEVGGFLSAARTLGFEPVPTLMGWATPSGPVTRDTYHALVERLLGEIDRAGPCEAVLLALHGAMVSEEEIRADARTAALVREKIGPDRPLVVTLDFHANLDPALAESADAILAYQTYPHVDQRSIGIEAAGLAVRAAQGSIRPVTAIANPPALIHLLAQATDREPMLELIAEAKTTARQPGMLSASVLAGFPYADVPYAGASCVAVADGDREMAVLQAARLGERLWSHRAALTSAPPGPVEAVALALKTTRTPAILVDIGDNIGGGSAADSTVLFHEWLRQGGIGGLVVLFDPEAARNCFEAGLGSQVNLEVGGKIDRNAPPLTISGAVVALHDGRYVEDQPRHGGIRSNDQGPTALVRLADDNLVAINSLRHPPFSLGQLTSLGIDPGGRRAIVVKAAVAYKAAYLPLDGTIIDVDTPGLTACNPARFTYRHVRRPILPLDSDFRWEPPNP